MTDYLELLLEEQEGEESSPVTEWKRTRILPGTAVRWNGERLAAETVRPPEEAQEKTKMAQAQQGSDGRRFFENESLRVRTVEKELLRLRRAVRQTEVQRGRPVEGSGNAAEGTAGFLRTGGKTQFRTADYAALVDAAFARDARRYDGLPGLL